MSEGDFALPDEPKTNISTDPRQGDCTKVFQKLIWSYTL